VSILVALLAFVAFAKRLMPITWFCATADIRVTLAVGAALALFVVIEFVPLDFEWLTASLSTSQRFRLIAREYIRSADENPPLSILSFEILSPRPPPAR
jgi:hypothetical protein